jgi:hypothetical protein
VTKVEFFANDQFLGTATFSPYTVSARLDPGTYLLTAKATDDQGLTATSAAVSITVNAPNKAPNIVLTSPLDGANFSATDTITLGATATDEDGSIAKVQFFIDGVLLSSDNSAPYAASTSLSPGTHTILATATDDSGATASTSITIQVHAPNLAPTVTLASPQSTQTILSPGRITLEAAATDDDGTIVKVEFFSDNTLLGEVTASPFNLTLNDLAPGDYHFTAVATDDAGLTATSTSIEVKIVLEPKILSITASEFYSIKATATAGVSHTLQGSADFKTWIDVESIVPASSEVTFTDRTTEPHRFYRVRIP